MSFLYLASSFIFVLSCFLFIGCECVEATFNSSKPIKQFDTNLFMYISLGSFLINIISSLNSEEFWKMQKAMIYSNTQAFGIYGGEIK